MLAQETKDGAYNDFQLFFNRLVCMSSVKVVADPFHTWPQVQGINPHHMAAGHTKAEPTVYDKAGAEVLEVEHAIKRAHDAFKILFFNKDQMSLLTTDKFPNVLFLCDFGAGNYQLLKSLSN